MTDEKYRPADPVPFYFDCPLCGQPLDVRASKKEKPYVTCVQCSLQMFVRGQAGIERFNRLAYARMGEPGTEGLTRRADALPKLVPVLKLPRGRPRKDPVVAARVERLAPAGALGVLTRRMP